MALILKSNTRATICMPSSKAEHYSPKMKIISHLGNRSMLRQLREPRGKILRNHSISLQARSDSEMEDKPPSTYAPLSTTSMMLLLL